MLWSDRDIEEIKRRAFIIYQYRQRNREDGNAEQDFFNAEQDLLDEILAKEIRDGKTNRVV